MYTLLTGGAGYIGSSIAYYLLLNNEKVIIVDNFSNSSESFKEKLPNRQNLLVYNIDCCDYKNLEKVFLENKINTIIHLASLKAVGDSIKNPLQYYENNLTSSINILKIVKEFKIPKFIFSSSATVYGNHTSPLHENNQTGIGITNPYGMSKWMIEKIIIDAAKITPSTYFIILRYFNPVGSVENGIIQENPLNTPNNLMPVIIHSIKKNIPFKVFGTDYDTHDGTAARDYIHIEDLAKGHIKAIEYKNNDDEKNNINIFNLGTGISYTVMDIVKTFEKVNGVNLRYILADRRPGDLENVYCSPSQAEAQLGWKAEKKLEDMCDFKFLF